MNRAQTNQTGTEARTYKASDARKNFAEVLDEAVHRGPVFVRRHRHKVVILSAERFDELISREANRDAKAADLALNDYLTNGGVELKKLKEELGLD